MPLPELVYVIECGEHEGRHVMAVAASIASAVDYLKTTYAAPYQVRWEDVLDEIDSVTLTGHFEQVLGYSTRHVARFEITAHALISPVQSAAAL